MSEANGGAARSVVVAVDASVRGLRIVDRAAALAGQLRIELRVLLIEDESLVRLAGLPFAREVSRTSGIERVLDAAQLNRALRASSNQLRQAIDRVAAAGQIRAHMRVVRGHYLAEALSASKGRDVLFLGGALQSLMVANRQRLGGASRMPLTPTAAWSRNARQSTCCVLYTGTAAAARALDMAATLPAAAPSSSPSPLNVLIASHSAGDAVRLREEVARTLAGMPHAYELIDVRAANAVDLIRYLRRVGCGLLVVPRSNSDDLASQVTELLKGLDCPLVLVG